MKVAGFAASAIQSIPLTGSVPAEQRGHAARSADLASAAPGSDLAGSSREAKRPGPGVCVLLLTSILQILLSSVLQQRL